MSVPSERSAYEDSRPKKFRAPNWSNNEIGALITTKSLEHERKLKKTDDKENMISAPNAWYAISQKTMDLTGYKI